MHASLLLSLQPLDDSQPPQSQHGENGMALDRKQEQPGPTSQDCTKTETWERHDRCRQRSKGSRSTHHAGSMSRQARHLSQREVLLPTASAATSPSLTWRRICGNFSSRICHEPHWLLQRPAGWCTESGDGQLATGHELRSTYRQQHA